MHLGFMEDYFVKEAVHTLDLSNLENLCICILYQAILWEDLITKETFLVGFGKVYNLLMENAAEIINKCLTSIQN